MSVIAFLASSLVQSLPLQFKSQEILTPLAFAALQASMQISTTFSPSAGVIPVKWNQSAPSKMLS